jgi:5-methylcytosine-specific restriction enzyme subunit McrC
MERVFEQFIGALLQRVVCPPGRSAALQLARRSLLVRSGGAPVYRLRPDVGIFEGQRLVCLVDTKWKRLELLDRNFGVAQDDMYQMYAYGKEYGCPIVVLLYPRHGDLKARVASYRHPPGEDGCARIEVTTVSMGLPAVSPSGPCVAAELRSLLDGLLERSAAG